jgi:uncharacterized membrane protein YecN with MAPEG domain
MFELPAIITGLALIFYSILTFKVGMARGKYSVKAPAITGHEMFERNYRVQMNMLEQIIFFLPSMWLFAVYLDAPKAAAALGAVWLMGRIWYAHAYVVNPSKRIAGFVISLLSSSILLLGGLVGAVMNLFSA